MCRTSRTVCGENDATTMTPPKNHSAVSYADRLDTLKRVLKPYRDNNANCLRSITRSARVNLNRHWKSLENLFAASVRDRATATTRNAANERLEDGENAVVVRGDPTADAIDGLGRLRVDR